MATAAVHLQLVPCASSSIRLTLIPIGFQGKPTTTAVGTLNVAAISTSTNRPSHRPTSAICPAVSGKALPRFALMSATTRFNLASDFTEVCGRRHLHNNTLRPAYEKQSCLKLRRCTKVRGRRHSHDSSMRPGNEKPSLLKPLRCTEVCGRRHLHDTSMRPAYEKPSLLKPRMCTEVCETRGL